MRFIIFGNVPLASWVLDKLLDKSDLEVIGTVITEKYLDFTAHCMPYPALAEYSHSRGISLLRERDAFAIAEQSKKEICGLTIRYPKILKKHQINCFSSGILNFHGGVLPSYRGMDIATHVIINKERVAGGTIHYLNEGIDTGDIVSRKTFPLQGYETAHDVFLKIQESLQVQFLEILPKLVNGELRSLSQEDLVAQGEKVKVYRRSDTVAAREIKPPFTEEKLNRCARAFCFPNHEPAYLATSNGKIQLVWKCQSNNLAQVERLECH